MTFLPPHSNPETFPQLRSLSQLLIRSVAVTGAKCNLLHGKRGWGPEAGALAWAALGLELTTPFPG